jgi:hypothetical protein
MYNSEDSLTSFNTNNIMSYNAVQKAQGVNVCFMNINEAVTCLHVLLVVLRISIPPGTTFSPTVYFYLLILP